MTLRSRRLALALLLLPLVPQALVAESEAPKPAFPNIDADAPAGTGVTQPCLAPLEGVRCGRFRVWEDRAARSGRTIDLAFIVADAIEPGPGDGDAVTFFNGGPGSSTTAFAAEAIAFSDALRQRRDLLFLDFRGVGASGNLDCGVPYPGGVASRFGSIFPLDHIRACRDRLSRRARLELYSSNHNMDDLEELRRWLNYTALNLVGGSYGTWEIQVFLRRHPKSVRSVVLKGVQPIFAPGYVSHARGLQQALDELVRECAAQADCAAAYPSFDRTVEEVLTRVRRDPPPVEVLGETVRFGPGELGYALRGLLYGRAAEVPAFLTGALRGEWQPLVDYYLQRTGWVAAADGEAGMHFSVLCAEDIDRVSAEQIEELTAETFLGDHLIGGYVAVCREWPHAELPPSFWEPVPSEVPALLFSGSRDPVTPPAGGEAVAAHFPNSLHVVVPGAGHLLFGPCLDRIEAQFLEMGTARGLDVSCLEERPPTAFVLPGKEPG